MNTQEIAEKLAQHCREGKNEDAIDDFYAENIVSYEMPGTPNEKVTGIDAVKQKSQQWAQSVEEIHSSEVSDPLVAGNFFTLTFKMDVTFKQSGRMQIEETAVYEVKDGKIVTEHFFYSM